MYVLSCQGESASRDGDVERHGAAKVPGSGSAHWGGHRWYFLSGPVCLSGSPRDAGQQLMFTLSDHSLEMESRGFRTSALMMSLHFGGAEQHPLSPLLC